MHPNPNQFSFPDVTPAVLQAMAAEFKVSPVDDAPTQIDEGLFSASYDYDSKSEILTVTILKHPFWISVGFIQSEMLGNLRAKCGYTGIAA